MATTVACIENKIPPTPLHKLPQLNTKFHHKVPRACIRTAREVAVWGHERVPAVTCRIPYVSRHDNARFWYARVIVVLRRGVRVCQWGRAMFHSHQILGKKTSFYLFVVGNDPCSLLP